MLVNPLAPNFITYKDGNRYETRIARWLLGIRFRDPVVSLDTAIFHGSRCHEASLLSRHTNQEKISTLKGFSANHDIVKRAISKARDKHRSWRVKYILLIILHVRRC